MKYIIIKVEKNISFINSNDLESEIYDCIDAKPNLLMIDCRDLNFIDISGISTLIKVSFMAKKNNCLIKLINTNNWLNNIFESLGIDKFFSLI